MGFLLMLIAFVLFLIAGLIAATDLDGGPPLHALLYFGLASMAASFLVGSAGAFIAKVRE